MPQAKNTGRFITLEGGEGAGKSTLARGLEAALQAQGREVVVTREPGGSPGADEIRALLLSGAPDRWDALADTLLFLAARADHVARTIRPALQAGRTIICDRYSDSTRAYQVVGGRVPAATLDLLEQATAFPVPDLTIVLDVDPASGVARSKSARAGEDRFERFDAAFHARVRQAFLDIAKAAPQRCVVIDASAPKERVLKQALDAIAARLT